MPAPITASPAPTPHPGSHGSDWKQIGKLDRLVGDAELLADDTHVPGQSRWLGSFDEAVAVARERSAGDEPAVAILHPWRVVPLTARTFIDDVTGKATGDPIHVRDAKDADRLELMSRSWAGVGAVVDGDLMVKAPEKGLLGTLFDLAAGAAIVAGAA